MGPFIGQFPGLRHCLQHTVTKPLGKLLLPVYLPTPFVPQAHCPVHIGTSLSHGGKPAIFCFVMLFQPLVKPFLLPGISGNRPG